MEHAYTYSNECLIYSQFRRDWKANYKKLTKKIRASKRQIAQFYQDERPLSASEEQSRLARLRSEARAANEALAETRTNWFNLLHEGHQWRTLKQPVEPRLAAHSVAAE